MKNKLFLPVLAILLLSACEATKNTPVEETSDEVPNNMPIQVQSTPYAASIKLGPCYGRCPVYEMSFDEKRNAVFNGKRFTDKLGNHSRTITEAEYSELQAAFAAADWWNLEDKYDNRIVDAPFTTIMLRQGEREKTIQLRGNMPENVKVIVEKMTTMATTGDWKLESQPDYGLPDGYIANELIIQLKGNAMIEDFIIPFQKQQMRLKRTISKPTNIHLVTFDPSMVTPQEMLDFVKNHQDCKEAEFNKKVSPRED